MRIWYTVPLAIALSKSGFNWLKREMSIIKLFATTTELYLPLILIVVLFAASSK
jgi:hypothetical protein